MSTFAIPALKWGLTGLGALGGLFGAKKIASGAAGQPSAQEQAYGKAAMGAGTTLQGQGRSLFNLGMPQLQQAGRYFGDLLGGSRAKMTQAIQPEAGAIRELSRGAGRGIERSNLRGAQRDQAQAELSRSTTGQIGSLLPAIRPQAASALAGLGQYGTSAGTNATGQAGGIFASLLGGEQGKRLQEQLLKLQAGQSAGGGIADILFSVLPLLLGKGGGKGLTTTAPPINTAEG